MVVRDWSLIMGRGGATKWENRGSESFCAPPPHPSRQGKTFHAPPPAPTLKECKLLHTPPPPASIYGKNVKLLSKNYPKTFSAPPSAWLKLFLPLLFVAPPPLLPVINDQSLS